MTPEYFSESALSRDDFLGGQLKIWQPREGYRAGVDPVLLAATIPAQPGDVILELGCGGGIGLACLGRRVENLELYGAELQPAYAELAKRNLAANGLTAQITCADLRDLPDTLRRRSFDHIFANPPYFDPAHRSQASRPDREIALAGDAQLGDWLTTAARRLRSGGTATFIQRAERLPEMLTVAQTCLGSLELWPLSPRDGRPPRLILLRGRKSSRAGFRFHAPLTLHIGQHSDDTTDYSAAIQAVLASGAALPFPT